MLTTLRLSRRHHGHPRHLRSFHRFFAPASRLLRLPPLRRCRTLGGGKRWRTSKDARGTLYSFTTTPLSYAAGGEWRWDAAGSTRPRRATSCRAAEESSAGPSDAEGFCASTRTRDYFVYFVRHHARVSSAPCTHGACAGCATHKARRLDRDCVTPRGGDCGTRGGGVSWLSTHRGPQQAPCSPRGRRLGMTHGHAPSRGLVDAPTACVH